MKKLWIGLLLGGSMALQAQSLVQLGMENVARLETDGSCYLTWEDPVYRGTYRGLFEVLRTILKDTETATDFYLVVQENQIPQIEVVLRRDVLRGYQDGTLSLRAVMQELEISYDTDQASKKLRAVKRENRPAGKTDLVIYPQLRLDNSWFDKLYGTVINVAPALEMQLWKGASFTGQVIFPLWNNMKGEMDYIRPGMLVLRQEVRLPSNLFATLSVGNFNAGRMGAEVSLLYRQGSGRWAFGLDGGLTGSSTFYGGQWELSEWRRLNGSLLVEYNEPVYNLEFDLRASRYVYGDYGVRLDCTRHFGEVSVGLYAMYTGGEANGGFHFSIPLPRKKRFHRKSFRIRLPAYFDWEYEAQSGNEYAARRLGRRYETRPDENHSERYYNPAFIQGQLIRLAEKTGNSESEKKLD